MSQNLNSTCLKIYIDESGHTGADLLNDDQSIFSVASNILSDDEASEIYDAVFGDLHKHYPKAKEPGFELKHKMLIQSGPGRKRSIDFIKRLQALNKKTFIYSIHKEFALLCILVDQWIETAHYENDIDFYAHDRARYYPRIVFHSFIHANSKQLLRNFLNICVSFIRNPSIALLRSLSELMEIGFRHKNEIIRNFFHLIDWSFQTIGVNRTASNALDLTYTSLFSIAVFWQNTYPGRFHIVHDESNEVAQHRESWKQLTDKKNIEAVFELNGQKIEFPLRIDGLDFVNSSSCIQIQFSDILAGAVAEHMRFLGGLTQDNKRRAYAQELHESGILELNIDGIFPLEDFEPERDVDYGDAQKIINYVTNLHAERQTPNRIQPS